MARQTGVVIGMLQERRAAGGDSKGSEGQVRSGLAVAGAAAEHEQAVVGSVVNTGAIKWKKINRY